MTIASLDDYIASAKQLIPFTKTTTRTTVGTNWFSMFDVAGNPGAGVLAGTSTAVGVVPTDATAGCPTINFSSGTGYLSIVDFANTVAARLAVFDMVFKAGAYGFGAGTTTLGTQPSYVGRMPGSSYVGTQIWIEVSTAFVTGNNWTVTVTYTDQDGNTGATTGASATLAAANLTIGKLIQMPLAAGDTGVSKIESVVVTNGVTAMTVGAFNVLVLRPLWSGRINVTNQGDNHGMDRTGLPIVFLDTALYTMVNPDSTSSGLPDLLMEIASN